MNCRRFESQAADWAAGRLSGEEIAALDRHRVSCASCTRLLLTETHLRQAWNDRAAASPTVADLWPRLAERLEPRCPRRASPVPRLVWSGAAAAAVIVMFSLHTPAPPSAHPVSIAVSPAKTASLASPAPSAEAIASWSSMDDVAAPHSVVDDPAGTSMEDIWTHIKSDNN